MITDVNGLLDDGTYEAAILRHLDGPWFWVGGAVLLGLGGLGVYRHRHRHPVWQGIGVLAVCAALLVVLGLLRD